MKDLINLTGNLSFDEAKAIIGDYMSVLCVAEKGVLNYAAKPIDKQKHLQTNGRSGTCSIPSYRRNVRS